MSRILLLVTGLLWAMAGVAPAAPAEQLKSFDQLMAALKSGEQVRVVIHYGRCILVSGKDTIPAPQAVGGMPLGTFEYFAANSIGNPQAFVTFSETVLITTRKGKYLYNYVKLKAFQDGRVEIIARYLRPKDFKTMMDETFYGRIGEGGEADQVCFYRPGAANR